MEKQKQQIKKLRIKNALASIKLAKARVRLKKSEAKKK